MVASKNGAARVNGHASRKASSQATGARAPSHSSRWLDVEKRKVSSIPAEWTRSIVAGLPSGEGAFGSATLPDPSAFGAGVDGFGMRNMPLNASGGFGSFSSPVVRVGITLSDAERVTRPFEQNPWVRAAIKAIAGGFVQMRPRIFDRSPEEDGAQAIDVPDLERLLQTPNPAMTRRRFMRAIATDLKLCGESFNFLQDKEGKPVPTNADGTFKEWPARVIPASGRLVQHQVDKNTGMPVAYRYKTNAQASSGDAGYSETFPAESVIVIIDYDPTYIIRGVGDVQALTREIALYFDAQRYLEASVRNGGQPGGFITFKTRMSSEELLVRQDVLNDELLDGETGQKYKILDNEARFTPNPTKPKDLEYRSLLEWLREAILAALGVPPPVVGIYDSATYNNVDTAYRELWRGPNGILTLAAEIDDAFTTQLVRRCAGLDRRLTTAEFFFDSEHVKVLREDRTEQVDKATEVAARGVGVSTNAALAAMGSDAEVEGGDFSSTHADTPKQIQTTTKARSQERGGGDLVDEEILSGEPVYPPDGGTPELRSALLGWLQDYVAATVAKVTAAAEEPEIISRSFAGLARMLTRSLDNIFDPEDLTSLEWNELILDDSEWIARMSEAVGEPLEDIFRAGLAQALLDAPDGPILTMSDPSVFKALASQEIKLTEGVTARAAQRVKVAILEALASPGGDPAAGLSMRERIRAVLPDLTPKLEKVFGTLEARAATIAQTEYGKADSTARMAQYRASGVTEIQWFTSRDSAVRASHKPLHGEKVPLGARFSNGLRFPLDPDGTAGEVINCFPGSTLVQGAFVGGLKAAYSGPLVEVVTANGHRLSVTPNHPVLTMDGWVPAGKLKEGMSCLRYSDDVGNAALRNVDQQDGPVSIEEAFHSIGSVGTRRLRVVRALDLHGDAAFTDREVEVVDINGELLVDGPASSAQDVSEFSLVTPDAGPVASSARSLLLRGDGSSARSVPRSGALALDSGATALLDAPPLDVLLIGSAARLDAVASQEARDRGTADPRFLRQLLQAGSGLVTPDKVVRVRVVDFDGHVFDLQSVGGWIAAQSLIHGNCRCTYRPSKRLKPDPETL